MSNTFTFRPLRYTKGLDIGVSNPKRLQALTKDINWCPAPYGQMSHKRDTNSDCASTSSRIEERLVRRALISVQSLVQAAVKALIAAEKLARAEMLAFVV